jgi:hypothetical protein
MDRDKRRENVKKGGHAVDNFAGRQNKVFLKILLVHDPISTVHREAGQSSTLTHKLSPRMSAFHNLFTSFFIS